jgi:hypothetical protein
MCPVHGLEIHLRVPITIIQDNSVGSHQVETQTTCSSRDEEDELVSIRRSEVINLQLSVIELGTSIKSAIFVLHESAVVLKNIQHRCKSREDQALTVVCLRFAEESVQELHLAASFDDMITQFWSVLWLDSWEQIRMVTDFSKLHQDVFVVADGAALLNRGLLEELSVYRLLSFSDSNVDMHLNLGKQAFLDLSFDSSKHERSNDFMKLFNNIVILSGLFFVA